MPIQIGQRPDHGFDEPLGLLSDCHRRIEHFLYVLATVAEDAHGGELNPPYRRALESAMTYFAEAAPRHTADEEVSLFPRLRDNADATLAAALAALDALERDHDQANAHHTAVDALARQWLATGRLSETDATTLLEHLTSLQALYRRHIAIEDREVFPAAARALDRAQISQIGNEMAARRNARVPAI